MPNWKKVIVSGSNANLAQISASAVPTATIQNLLAIDSSTGGIMQITQSNVNASGDNLGDHTATTTLDLNGNNLISASAVFVQGPVTASVTGSSNPSDFFPTGIGGTYSPPTFTEGNAPATTTAEIDFSANNPDLPWPAGVPDYQDRPFVVNLPDRVPGTDVKILEISASGDLDAGGNEYIWNLTIADQI